MSGYRGVILGLEIMAVLHKIKRGYLGNFQRDTGSKNYCLLIENPAIKIYSARFDGFTVKIEMRHSA